MSNFVYDGTDLPTDKVDVQAQPGPSNQKVTAAEWNAAMQAAKDLRGAVLDGKFIGLASDPTVPVASPGKARLRNNAGALEVSANSAPWQQIVGVDGTQTLRNKTVADALPVLELRGLAGAAARIVGMMLNAASAVGLVVDTATALTAVGAKLLSIRSGGVEKFAVEQSGKVVQAASDTTGTPDRDGGQNAGNTALGLSFVPPGDNFTFITCAACGPTSLVFISPRQTSPAVKSWSVSVEAGGFWVDLDGVPTDAWGWTFNWEVKN